MGCKYVRNIVCMRIIVQYGMRSMYLHSDYAFASKVTLNYIPQIIQ